MLYSTFLFLHIIGVVVWLGGALVLTVLNLRLMRAPAPVRKSLSDAGEFFGRAAFGPAAALTLISGLVMIGLAGWMTPAWVIWGFCGLVLSALIGAVFISRASRLLNEPALAEAAGAEAAARKAALQRRMTAWSVLDVLILLSVVAVMVFKPGF